VTEEKPELIFSLGFVLQNSLSLSLFGTVHNGTLALEEKDKCEGENRGSFRFRGAK
jgi:hypothetical protein